MSEIVDCIAFIVRKACWSFYVCAKFVTLRVLDLLGLVFNILACLTIIRLPAMIKHFSDMDSMTEWRSDGFVQIMIFLSDIPFMLMFLILAFGSFGLLLRPLYKNIKEEDVVWDFSDESSNRFFYGGFHLRRIIAVHFFRMLCDVFCVPLALICLCSWRCMIFVRKVREENYKWEDWDWRRHCFIQAVHLLVDIPCILVGMVVMLTWRSPFLIRNIKEKIDDDEKWDSYRLLVFPEFILIFVDIFCMLLFVFTLLTWRSPLMIIALKEEDNMTQWKVRSIILQQALLVWVDLPCILCAVVVLVTIWRIPNLIRNFTKDEWKLRATCCKEAAMLLVDLACFILILLIVLTLWRIYPLSKSVRKYWTIDPKKRSWKIRKAIGKHFLFLFVDVPALILCILFLVTVFRLPKLVSKLLQTGDFYTEFAITVFYQTGRLIVDFVFLCLFIILMILRPIQSWVHLLEDDEHKKMRLLKHYIQWVPDIIQKRHQMRREMEEVFSSSLKERHTLRKVQVRLSVVNASYLKDLQWIRDKVQKYQLDEEYGHLIHMVQWWEGKRAHKMTRLYSCEMNFLDHPSQSLHNSNLQRFKNEMLVFEMQVNKQYQAVENFSIPKVPLWSEFSGLKTRSRKETQYVLIKCLPHGRFVLSLLILLNLVFLYRGPVLIRNLWRRWYDRRNIVFASTKEYFRDLQTILRIVLVLVLLFRAPFLIADITQDIFLKRSWKAVRETAKRYPPYIWEDLINFFSTILSWETIRYAFTALLFGVLIPADLFLTMMKKITSSKCLAFMATSVLYIVFMGFPVLLPYYLVSKLNGDFISVAIGLFALLLLVVLIGSVVAMVKDQEDPITRKPEPYNYIHFNWSNVHVIIFEIIELLQLLAIVFAITELPMMGAGILGTASNYLLLNFATFEIKMWMTLGLFVAWFFCCSAPVIFEHVLESLSKGTCKKHVGWTLLLSLFSNTLFVTFVESFLTFVSCKYTDCPASDHRTAMNMTNGSLNSCVSAVLYEDSTMRCWEGAHRAVATAGMLGLVWYASTAIIFGMRYGGSSHPHQDLKFSLIYNTFINFIKAFMIGVVVLAAANRKVVFGCFMLANIAAILFTVFYQKMLHHQLANSSVLKLWRQVSFLCGFVAALAALVAEIQDKQDNFVPLVIFVGGCACVLVLAAAVSIIQSRTMTPVEQTRQHFRDGLRRLEKQLVKNGHMVNSWTKRQSQWKRLIKGVHEAQKGDSSIPTYPDLVVQSDPSPENPIESQQGQPPSDADALPPPPPYEDLFPNIFTPYGTIPPPPPYSLEDSAIGVFDAPGDAGSHGDMISVDAIGGDGVERGIPPPPPYLQEDSAIGVFDAPGDAGSHGDMISADTISGDGTDGDGVEGGIGNDNDEAAAGPSSSARDDDDAIVGVVGIEAGDTERDGDSSDDHAAGRHGDSSGNHVAGRHGDPGLEEDVSDATSGSADDGSDVQASQVSSFQ